MWTILNIKYCKIDYFLLNWANIFTWTIRSAFLFIVLIFALSHETSGENTLIKSDKFNKLIQESDNLLFPFEISLKYKALPLYLDHYIPDFEYNYDLHHQLPDNFEIDQEIGGNFFTSNNKKNKLIVANGLIKEKQFQPAIELLTDLADQKNELGKYAAIILINTLLPQKLNPELHQLLDELLQDESFQIASEAYYLKFRIYFNNKEYKNIITLYNNAWNNRFYNYDLIFKVEYLVAQTWFFYEKYDLAYGLVEKLLLSFPDSNFVPSLNLLRSDILFKQKKYQEAAIGYKEISKNHPQIFYFNIYIRQLWSIYLSNNWEELDINLSLFDFNKIDSSEFNFFSMVASLSENDQEKTLSYFNRISDQHIFQLAQILLSQQTFIQTEIELSNSSFLNNDHAIFYLQWFNMFKNIVNKNYNEALSQLYEMQNINVLESIDPIIKFNISLIEIELNNYQQALILLKPLVENSNETQYILAYYYTLYKQRDYFEILNRESKSSPNFDTYIDIIVGYALAKSNEVDLGLNRIINNWNTNKLRESVFAAIQYCYNLNLVDEGIRIIQQLIQLNIDLLEEEAIIYADFLLTKNNVATSKEYILQTNKTSDLKLIVQQKINIFEKDNDKILKQTLDWISDTHTPFDNFIFFYHIGVYQYENKRYNDAATSFNLAKSFVSDKLLISIVNFNYLQTYNIGNEKDQFINVANKLLKTELTRSIEYSIVEQLIILYQQQKEFQIVESIINEYLKINKSIKPSIWQYKIKNAYLSGDYNRCIKLIEIKEEKTINWQIQQLIGLRCAMRQSNWEYMNNVINIFPQKSDFELELNLTKLMIDSQFNSEIEDNLNNVLLEKDSKDKLEEYYKSLISYLGYKSNIKDNIKDNSKNIKIIQSIQDYPEILIHLVRDWAENGLQKDALESLIKIIYSAQTSPSNEDYLLLIELLIENSVIPDANVVISKLENKELLSDQQTKLEQLKNELFLVQ